MHYLPAWFRVMLNYFDYGSGIQNLAKS